MTQYWIYASILLSFLAALKSPDGIIGYFLNTPITALMNTMTFFAICAAGSLFIEWVQKKKDD